MSDANKQKVKLHIKDDHLTVFEVELNDNFNYGQLTAEERGAIDAKNKDFNDKALFPLLMNFATDTCACRGIEMQQRAMARAKLMPNYRPGMPIGLDLTQDDIDKKKFGVVIHTMNGVAQDVDIVVINCVLCGKIDVRGNGDIITRMCADYATRWYAENAIQVGLESGEYTMEDIDTGEVHDCTNLGEALMGDKDVTGLSMEEVHETSEVIPFPRAMQDE